MIKTGEVQILKNHCEVRVSAVGPVGEVAKPRKGGGKGKSKGKGKGKGKGGPLELQEGQVVYVRDRAGGPGRVRVLIYGDDVKRLGTWRKGTLVTVQNVSMRMTGNSVTVVAGQETQVVHELEIRDGVEQCVSGEDVWLTLNDAVEGDVGHDQNSWEEGNDLGV